MASTSNNFTLRNTIPAYAMAALPLVTPVPIQDVQLFDYACAHKSVNASYGQTASSEDTYIIGNDPYTSDQQRSRDQYEINDTDWNEVSFKKVNGSSTCKLALNNNWIEQNNYVVDGIVTMNLPEQGISGPFKITSIKHIIPQKKPVDEDESDEYEYRPVTGLFTHHSDAVHNITFDNKEILGVTAPHPIFSTTHNDWRLAGELEVGERVLTYHGEATVTSTEKKAGSEAVYNLEVKDLHNFLVGDVGVVVHNECTPGPDDCFHAFKELLKDYRKSLDDLLGNKISASTKDKLVAFACKVVNIEGLSIKWDQFGFPDFLISNAVFAIGNKVANYDISDSEFGGVKGMQGNNYGDYKMAADKMRIEFASEISNGSVVIGSDHRVKINGVDYTWHHHQGGKHMQLVKSSIHNANKPHLGGATLANEGLKGVFPDVDLAKKFKCK